MKTTSKNSNRETTRFSECGSMMFKQLENNNQNNQDNGK